MLAGYIYLAIGLASTFLGALVPSIIAPILSGLVALEYFLVFFGDETALITSTLTVISFAVFLIFAFAAWLMPSVMQNGYLGFISGSYVGKMIWFFLLSSFTGKTT